MIEKIKKWWFITESEMENSVDAVFVGVKPNQRRNTATLWILALAFGYTITSIVLGGDMIAGVSNTTAYWRSILVGYAVLCVLAFLSGYPSYKTGFNPTIFNQYVYGSKGYYLPALVLCVMLTLHHGFQMSTFAEVLFAPGTPQFICACIVCIILVCWSLVKGIKGLELASNIAIAFLLVSIVACVWLMLKDIGGIDGFNNAIDTATKKLRGDTYLLNSVIGTWTIGATNAGIYTRYSKNKVSAFGFVFIAFCAIQIVLAFIGSLGVLTTGSHLFTVYAIQLNVVFGIFCIIAFLLALWTTLNASIYLVQVPVSSVCKARLSSAGVILAIIPGFLAMTGFTKYTTVILNWTGSLLPPFIAPVIVDYFFCNRSKYYYKPEVMVKKLPKVNIWAIVAAVASFAISMVWIPSWMPSSIWSLILSAIIYVLLFYILKACGIKSGLAAVEIDEELENNKVIPYDPSQLRE